MTEAAFALKRGAGARISHQPRARGSNRSGALDATIKPIKPIKPAIRRPNTQ